MSQQTAVVVCGRCGRTADDDVPLDWAHSIEDGQTRQYCGTCARENLRAIEARLDPQWW